MPWVDEDQKKEAERNDTTRVVVTDVQMPFGSMVSFMVKWVIATIPAMLILAIIGAVIAIFLRLL